MFKLTGFGKCPAKKKPSLFRERASNNTFNPGIF